MTCELTDEILRLRAENERLRAALKLMLHHFDRTKHDEWLSNIALYDAESACQQAHAALKEG